MKELCLEAIQVQEACNLMAVLSSFSRAVTDLKVILVKENDFSTYKLNQHPVSILYASKVASLTGSEVEHEFGHALGFCQNQSQ